MIKGSFPHSRCLLPSALLVLSVTCAVASADSRLAEDEQPDRPKPHQVVSKGEPPQSPATFDPDPNRIDLFALQFTEHGSDWQVRVFRSASATAGFNPDPGAAPPPSLELVLDSNFNAFPPYGSEPVSEKLRLPRGDLRRVMILPAEARAPGNYGLDPLPNSLRLPRREVRSNQPIEINFHP
jgi:hypothetical protein